MCTFEKLDAALNAYDQHQAALVRVAETGELEDTQLLVDVRNSCRATAHPALERIWKHSRDRSHDFPLMTDDKPGITSDIYLADTSRLDPREASAVAPTGGWSNRDDV
jgi:hypothetical protein